MGEWTNDGLIHFSDSVPAFVDGRDSPRAFLDRCLDAIDARDNEIKAFVTLNRDGARAAAHASSERYRAGRVLSPVDGCPIGAKDIIETADMPTQMNSPIYSGWQSGRDAACVAALRRGGAVIVGKTVTTEFAAGRSGPTLNPFDSSRTPGGSSSGSAAAVAAGMLPAALGSQGGGSTIRPASYCGIYGFKPTLGALSMAGIHTVGPTHDHLGILAGNLEDLWRLARQISDGAPTPGADGLAGSGADVPPPVAPRCLVRLYTRGWKELDRGTIAAFENYIERLCSAGVKVVGRDDDPDVAALERELDDGVDGRHDIMSYEMRWPFEEYVTWHGAEVSEGLHQRMEHARGITTDDYRRLLEERGRMLDRFAGFATRADGFVTLASSGPAPKGLADTGSRTFLNYWSWLGVPSFSLPLLAVEGLPVGVQLVGYAAADDRLAAHAAWIMRNAG
jgi:Asp-tRNA(Asn)/Glu-tRNA(Gln) amidotransferase A subunit family amidase